MLKDNNSIFIEWISKIEVFVKIIYKHTITRKFKLIIFFKF